MQNGRELSRDYGRGERMNRLSAMQLAVMMICARCFSMMTYFPYTQSNTLVFMIAMLISTALQGLLLIPAAILCSRHGKGLCEIALERSRLLGVFVSVAFLLYFLWDIFMTTGTFAFFVDNYFSNHISRIPAVICAGAVAVYLGGLGSAALGKCAGVMFFLFALFTGVLLLSALDRPDFTNFHLAQDNIPKALTGDIAGELVRNRELVALVFLLGDVRGSKPKAVYSYLAVKLVILEVVMGFAALVLGEFAVETDMPFFYLSCYSNSSVIERYDAGFMAVWTVLGVVRLALAFHCSGRCLRLIGKRISRRTSILLVQIVPAAATFVLLLRHRWKGLAYMRETPWLTVCAVGLVPLTVLLFDKFRRSANED